jgi:hypothetical protein
MPNSRKYSIVLFEIFFRPFGADMLLKEPSPAGAAETFSYDQQDHGS